MGRRPAGFLGLGLLVVLTAGTTATPQDGPGPKRYYLPHRAVGFPVDLSQLKPGDAKPKEIQLFTSFARGDWKPGPKLAVGQLPDIGDGRKGFVHQADKDGGYEFGIVLYYDDGTTSPKQPADPKGPPEVRPSYDVVVDTTPPEVRIAATATGVEWTATDDNLDREFAQLQCRYTTATEWFTVKKAFKSSGAHNWTRPEGVLEVRVKARDLAGNDQWSRVVRVPGDAAVGASFPREAGGAGREPFGGGAGLPQPRFDCVATKDVSVEYTLPKIGRSGVKKVQLYVLPTVDGVQDAGGWKAVEPPFAVDYKQGDTPKPLPYKADKDGVYGFYVVPESGAGERARPPKRDDQPMVFMVVDTQAPFVQITAAKVGPGVGRSARVEIAWEAADPNLMPNAVDLEWSPDRAAAEWKEIKYKLSNTDGATRGRYAWDVPDENPWQFYIRARATDKAGNAGVHVWGVKSTGGEPTPVVVDLETPEAKISGVKGAGGGEPKKPDLLPKP